MSDILMKGTEPIGQVCDITADNVEYSSGVSVKDKIDEISASSAKIIVSDYTDQQREISFDNWSTYLVTIGGGGNQTPTLAILNKRASADNANLVIISNGIGGNHLSVTGNTLKCTLSGYTYQFVVIKLS